MAKKAAESSKVSSGDDILMAEATDTFQEKQPSSAIAADKSTHGAHASVDTFFVAGKEYLNSPVHKSSEIKQVSSDDITETLKPQGSVDNILNSDVQELNADPMEDLDVPHDDFAEGVEVGEDEIVTAEERVAQEKLFKEWEDYKRSSDMAEAEQAKFDSEYQSATQRYISSLPIERHKELDAAVQNFDESDWQHIGEQVIATPDLPAEILGDKVDKKDWVFEIVKQMKLRKKVADEQRAKAKRDKPMTQAQQRDYMRTYVKSQSSALYNNAWTRKQVWALSDEKLVQMYNRIKSRCDKDGMGAPKNVPITLDADGSSVNTDIHVVADKVSLPATSADVPPVAASSCIDKGKAQVIAEDPPSRKRTRKQMEEERLGEEAAKRLDDEQQADMARFHEIKERKVELQAARAK